MDHSSYLLTDPPQLLAVGALLLCLYGGLADFCALVVYHLVVLALVVPQLAVLALVVPPLAVLALVGPGVPVV